MSKRSPAKMGPRNIQYWRVPVQKFAPKNFGLKKGGAGTKKMK